MRSVEDNPPYVSGWINDDGDGEHDGLMVVLEGELDYAPGVPGRQVGEQFMERAEAIGAVVSHDPAIGLIRANPWAGEVTYELSYDQDTEDALIETIETFAKMTGEHIATHEVADVFDERGLDLDAARAKRAERAEGSTDDAD